MASEFNKVLVIGHVPEGHGWTQGGKVTLKVGMVDSIAATDQRNWNLESMPNGYREFSMSGTIGSQAGGQVCDDIAKMFPDNQPLQRLVAIWKEWHLNGMKAGTQMQETAIDAYKAETGGYDYGAACSYLKRKGLYTVVDANGKPYHYGHAWLVREMPQSVWDEVVSLCAELAGKAKPAT